MKLQCKENGIWRTFCEDTKEKCEEALEWNENNAKVNKTGKEFRVIK